MKILVLFALLLAGCSQRPGHNLIAGENCYSVKDAMDEWRYQSYAMQGPAKDSAVQMRDAYEHLYVACASSLAIKKHLHYSADQNSLEQAP